MGLKIMYDEQQGLANLYCSTSEIAFGPIFYTDRGKDGLTAKEEAQRFIDWCGSYCDLEIRYMTERQLTDAYCKYKKAAIQAKEWNQGIPSGTVANWGWFYGTGGNQDWWE